LKKQVLALPVGRQVRCYFVVLSFFCFGKKVRERNILVVLFGIAQKMNQKTLALERFNYPHFPCC
jgi:hypothetical protein